MVTRKGKWVIDVENTARETKKKNTRVREESDREYSPHQKKGAIDWAILDCI